MHADIARLPNHRIATGCGKEVIYVERCPSGVAQNSSKCSWFSSSALSADALKRRASYDLQCGPAQLQLTWLDQLSTGVAGCGRRATYVSRCPHDHDVWSEQCTWVLNTDSTREGALGPPPPGVPPGTAAPQPPPAPRTQPSVDVPPTDPAPVSPSPSAH